MNYLITGGTGSLGTALIAELSANVNNRRVVVYSRDEFKQAQLAAKFKSPAIRWFLGDVRDKDRLSHAMHGIDVVVHAAALKRVDSISYNPAEVIKTNVLGTMNVIEAAWQNGVRKVVVVSSDKAVEPMNMYGASKMMAEQYAIAANSYTFPSGTSVASVRYGNVLYSRGSVLEVWKGRDIVQVPQCTRFWLTLSQACDFILTVVHKMVAGWIYVPKLKGASIATLAEAAGKKIKGEFALRHGGEKRNEKLLSTDELDRTYDVGFGWGVKPALSPWQDTNLSQGSGVRREEQEYVSNLVEQFTVEELRAML